MTREELYAVLVALPGDTLLLPNAAVAEVVSPERLERASDAAPPWFAGSISYNNRRLPVVRFEVLNGARRSEDTRRTRVAIVQTITDRVRAGQYGIVCQGYPHLVTLNRTAVRKEPNVGSDRDAMVLTRVSIANTSALIPNLEAIEMQLATLEAAAG
jgi:chemosensory pili system protein ChpC